MKKNRLVFTMVITLIGAAILVFTVLFCVKQANSSIKHYSANELTSSTKQLAKDLHSTLNTDQTILSAMAEIISVQTFDNEESLLAVMNSFDTEKSFITHVGLLLPDNSMLRRNGARPDMTGKLDFDTEKEKGVYISDRIEGFLEEDDFVILTATPIIKNEQVVAILYGIASLDELSKQYSTAFYGGNNVVIMLDGTTGDILLDTWHTSLGNLSDLTDRKVLSDTSFSEATQLLHDGKGGDISTVSKSLAEPFYFHFEPIGINNWSVILGVSESSALAGTRSSSKYLYSMILIITLTMLVYTLIIMAYLISNSREVYKMSITDEATRLLNRSAYESFLSENRTEYFAPAACVYIDANGLHEINNALGHATGDRMLLSVADGLRKFFPGDKLYRVGGDEFVVFPLKTGQPQCVESMKQLAKELENKSFSISYGIIYKDTDRGLDNVVLEADNIMLENKKHYYDSHPRTPR